MVKRIEIPCEIGGRSGSFQVYLGRPAPGCHALEFQLAWLREVLGGEVPEEVLRQIEALTAAEAGD